ncbi:MAG TPA: amidohydrolase [Bryobacteraceae bacterium]|nr:amidohydrolase [Bryobacteraceae bacterium]
MSCTRRQFAGLLGAAALRGATIKPDTILVNGNIHTMDPANPEAEAVAIAGGRFLAVGTNNEVGNLSWPGVKKIDLGGRTVYPGFIDAHLHTASSGLRHLKEVNCDLRSIAAIQAAIRERAAKTPPGNWVVGFMYDDTKTEDGRPLRVADLDAAAPNHPVFINHRGGHTSWVNSRALNIADVNDKTPDPPGGKFERGADGKLTGRAMETANAVFRSKIHTNATRADRREGVKLITKMIAKSGITSVNDPQGSPEDLTAYQDAYESGDLSVRVYGFISQALIGRMLPSGVHTGLGNEWVRVGAMKMVCDGSISERDARVSQAYVGRPNDFGILVKDEEQLYHDALPAYTAGWQIGTHANGDIAIDIVLRVYERLQRAVPRRDPRFRIEHCTVINDDLVRRIKAQGVIPTPFSSYVYYHGEKMKEYGEERLNSMFALRSFLDAGIPATMSSDYPPGPFEPMMFLQSSVTRTDVKGHVWGPKQRIKVTEALRVATVHGAYASFEEKLKGSIEAGKLADLVVLGRDPLQEDPSTLVTIPVERTMVGGTWKFEA